MKILFITPFNIFPPYWGGAQRTFHLIKYLKKKHKIYLIFPSYSQFQDKDPKKYYKLLQNKNVKIYPVGNWPKVQIVEFLNPFFFLKLMYIIFSKKIDLIICDYPWVGAYTLFSHILSRRPYIFIEHNIEYEIKKQIHARYVTLMKWVEKILCEFAKRIIVVSRKDKNKLVRLGVNKRKILIIENGFDEERFYPTKKFDEKIRKKLNLKKEPIIFFCGKFDYAPNVEALYTIRWKILPKVLEKIPDAKFLIVGGGRNNLNSNLNHQSLIFTGAVDNIEAYLNSSNVVIIPIKKGGGTRIKILEAIACGKTVVTTKKGAEGLVNELTKPFLKITDDLDIFSEYIIEALMKSKSRKVSINFLEKYSWKNLYKKMDKIL